MKQYDSYKDSGVEWIGKVPSHWEILPFKRAITINNGCDYKHVQVEEDGYPVIGSGGQFAWASQYMYDGEVVLLGRKGTIDKPLYYKGIFWTVDTMFYGIPKKNANCKYLLYQAKNIPFERYATATALPSMTQTDLNNNAICMPPLKEQAAIANYLDKKCSEIDNVISAQQKRIALLQELKQSVITHAVTKGLDPNVEMKDSGVEWIGEVPSHWEVMKLKWLFWNFDHLRKPISAEKRERENPQYDYYGASGIIDKIDFYNVEDKVLLIGEDGANLVFRNLPLIYKAEGKFWVNNHAHILKPRKHVDFEYMYYTLEAGDYSIFITGSAQPKLSQSNLEMQVLPVPPYEEQLEIGEQLCKKCASIDASISKAQHQVDLLQEYKQSLVTEVVTGKRKVS